MALKWAVDNVQLNHEPGKLFGFDIDNVMENFEEFHRLIAETETPFALTLDGKDVFIYDEIQKAVCMRTINALRKKLSA